MGIGFYTPFSDFTEKEKKVYEKCRSIVTKRNVHYPNENSEQYRQRRYREWLAEWDSAKRVYLDNKFWVWLREPENAPHPEKTRRLLILLWKGVNSGKLICPVSYASFIELMKIFPQKKRIAHARLMDSLSQGVGLRNPFDIAELEYLSTLIKHLKQFSGPIWVDSVWSPVGNIILDVLPDAPHLPQVFVDESRKFMVEAGWARTMKDMAILDTKITAKNDAAEKINQARLAYPRNGKTFEELYAEELQGALEVYLPYIEKAVAGIVQFAGFSKTDCVLDQKNATAFINLFREVSLRGLNPEVIPTQRVQAALHALIRMDDTRLFKKNDADDISHSSVAIAYCDLFLTEKSFSHLLSSKQFRKAIPSKCRVTHNLDEAIKLIEQL